jgi:tetratricopeptide (TPR) repeat protein
MALVVAAKRARVMNPNPEQFARLEQLFVEALELSLPLRAALLSRVRQEEGEALADRLQALLAQQSKQTESMLEPPLRPAVPVPAARSAFHMGDLIMNRFRIIRLLGRGGMGEVYEAEDSEIGPVALKTIREDIRGDGSLLQRFKQEVQLARLITSPYVCRIHELFTLPPEGNHPAIAFLTMEFLEGASLADRIASPGPLPWREAELIALQLCQGLEAIHNAGVIHRDFKSRNVMLSTHSGAPRAVVMDLGLARHAREDLAPLTLAGAIMGTPGYMAPEQFEGGPVSPATDIYAFGVMLYEMVTGKLPFKASTPVAAAVRRARRLPPASSIQPGVPHRWDAVIEKCLEYEPAQRFQSATELAAALRAPAAGTAGLRALIPDRFGRRKLGAVLACLGFLASAVVGLRWYQSLTAHKVPEEAQAYYREATGAFHNGNYLTATRQLQEALKLDPDFALAHARLADAFNELDSTGEAQREVNQIKEELVSQLSSPQRTYVHAVRESVRPDANAAVKDYEKLLGLAAPPAERANALVDLGRASERAGRISEAIQRYGQAALLDPFSPASFLRRGILESRQGKQKEADTDFAKANKFYATNINLEGTAEVDYQRSYVASKLGPGHEQEARKFFRESLDAAEQMQSVALRVRALSRLSAIEFGAGHDEEAGQVASDAIHLAEENGVAYWATDARLRLGNSWTYRDAKQAETILERARAEAQRNQWPRLLALGQLSLAALTGRQQTRQRQHQTIDLASPADDYYRIFGFSQESFQCQVLLSRAKAFFGALSESLQHAQKALELATGLDSSTELLQAQEAVGSALLWKQDYLAALDHFTSAFQIAEGMPDHRIRAYYMSEEALFRAEALCWLGRIEEANLAVAAVPPAMWTTDTDAKLGFLRLQAVLLKSQGKYKEALLIAQKALREGAASSDQNWDFQLVVAAGLTHTGNSAKALALCDQILAQAGEQSAITVAETKLVKARALLEERQWMPARALAEEVGQFFRATGQKESELVSSWITFRSYGGAGSVSEAQTAAHKMRDMLSDFRHNYETDNYQIFIRRAEIAEVVSDEVSPGNR